MKKHVPDLFLHFIFLLLSGSTLAQNRETDTMVPMRDGVNLATDVYFPTNFNRSTDKLPVILHGTPYDKLVAKYVSDAEYFTQNGYIVVFQDCRGRFKSEGVFGKYLNEPEDSFDAVEWVGKQPWCTANVFKKGHRIRVDISSSNFPQYDVNPNTGEPLGRNLRQTKANNTLWHGSAKPSYIVLPILEK